MISEQRKQAWEDVSGQDRHFSLLQSGGESGNTEDFTGLLGIEGTGRHGQKYSTVDM